MENNERTGLEEVAEKVKGAAKTGKAIANIARGAAKAGIQGAAVEAVKSFKKEIVIIAVVLLSLPILFIALLPQVIFGGLNPPDTGDPIMNDNPQIIENISEINNIVSQILSDAYQGVRDTVEEKAASDENAEIEDEVGGEIVFDANQIICWYSASQDKSVEQISIPHLQQMVAAHKDELYYYLTRYEQRTVTETDDEGEEHEKTVTFTIYTIKYAGEDIFPTDIFGLDEEQLKLADDFAANLTIFLYDSYEAAGNGTHKDIEDMTGDDDSPPPEGDFGNPFPGSDWSNAITSGFGGRPYPGVGSGTSNHTGLDIGYPEGTSIHAVKDGTVLFVRDSGNSGYGKHVAINHGGGVVTLYAHCSKILVSEGQKVRQGDVIAKIGHTGWATGPHLHIEVIIDGQPVDPIDYISRN